MSAAPTPPTTLEQPPTPTRGPAEEALAGLPYRLVPARDPIPTLEVEAADLHEVLQRLRDRAAFASVTFVTGVDRLPREPRFEVVHQLHSLAHPAPWSRVRVRTGVPGADPRVPTCVDLWPGAAFMERECFDMFGIVFEGHPGLKRLLMPEGYGHHPLRKDFPHQGIEPDRLYREWDAARRREWDPGR